jgi:uncharacterized membrane protein
MPAVVGALFVFALMVGAVLVVPISLMVLWRNVRLLTARVAELERQAERAGQAGQATPPASVLRPPPLSRPLSRPVSDAVPSPTAATTPVPTAAPARAPMPAPTPAPTPASTSISATSTPTASASASASTSATGDTREWETVVGASWLNKIGVLVLVLGLGFLLAYSFAHLGPAGRIILGYLVSAILLGGGVYLASQDASVAYGQGLIAGGWAGLYLTTFAAHGIPSARVLDSDLLGVVGLMTVAAGMIAHSLKFKSLPMTSLAYLVAYATLAQTPLSGFSLAAGVPLTASLLVIAVRAGWPVLAMMGLATTYGLFAIREQLYPAAALDPDGIGRYLALGVYWLLFEASDLADRRRQSPIGAMNLTGFMGVVLLRAPRDPHVFAYVLSAAALALLAGAAIRVMRPASTDEISRTDAMLFTSAHVSVAMASALFAWASFVLFDDTRTVVALLLNAELLIASGTARDDRALRAIGLVAAVVTTVTAWLVLALGTGVLHAERSLLSGSFVAGLVALVWYANDAWLRSRPPSSMMAAERVYCWAGFSLGMAVAFRYVPERLYSPTALAASAALLERARRVREDYLPQALVAFGLGIIAAIGFEPSLAPAHAVWIVQPASLALAGWLTWRLATTEGEKVAVFNQRASSVMTVATAWLFATFLWRILPAQTVAAAWAITAAALGLASRRPSRVRGFDFAAAGLLVAAAARSLDTISGFGPLAPAHALFVAVVIGVLFATSVVGASDADPHNIRWHQVRQVFGAAVGTLLLTLMTFDMLQSRTVTVAWGLEGLALLGVGFALVAQPLRLSGLAMLLVCLVKLFGHDLQSLDALPRILSFVGLGIVLLVVSWVYTKRGKKKDG